MAQRGRNVLHESGGLLDEMGDLLGTRAPAWENIGKNLSTWSLVKTKVSRI